MTKITLQVPEKHKKIQTLREREGYIRYKYGKDLDWYYRTIIAQDNKCPICGRIFGKGNRKAVIDHNHKTGEVRSILCDNCNQGLGQFQENTLVLQNAINYLTKWE